MVQQMVQEIFTADNWRITDPGSLVSTFFSRFVFGFKSLTQRFQLKAKSGAEGVAQSEGDGVI